MPFRTELDGVYAAVTRACRNLGYECVRADEIDKPGAILVQIMRHVQESQVVIADLSGSNPNVFYELGMAHVRKENVILLTQEVGQVPFDLRHWRLIAYENSQSGRRRLRERVERMMGVLPNEPITTRLAEADSHAQRLEEILEQRGLGSPQATDFGGNDLNRRLFTRHEQCEHGSERPRCVVFCGGPRAIDGDIVDTSSADFRQWFHPNTRRYEPNTGSFFVPYESTRLSLDGILATETSRQEEQQLRSYLLVMKHGYVERGRDLAMCYQGQAVFRLTPIVSELWQFIGFMRELYELHQYSGPFKVFLNMINTRDSKLCDLGLGWREPFELGYPEERFVCELPNIQLTMDNLSIASPNTEVDEQVRKVALLIDNAYGFWDPRAFNSPKSQSPGALNPRYV